MISRRTSQTVFKVVGITALVAAIGYIAFLMFEMMMFAILFANGGFHF